MTLEERKKWSLLRYDYHASGRANMLYGNFGSGGIMLGYAVEAALKHALLESGYTNKKVLHSHDHLLLFDECKQKGILAGVDVAREFLEYIYDHHKPRYPSLASEVSSSIAAKNRIEIIGPLLLPWYDDLLHQIDSWILASTNDPLASSAFRVTGDVFLPRGKIYFHAHYHACLNLQFLTKLRVEHDGKTSAESAELEKGPANFWASVSGVIQPQMFENVHYEERFSKRFHYPVWSVGPQPSFKMFNWNCIMVNLLPWESPPGA